MYRNDLVSRRCPPSLSVFSAHLPLHHARHSLSLLPLPLPLTPTVESAPRPSSPSQSMPSTHLSSTPCNSITNLTHILSALPTTASLTLFPKSSPSNPHSRIRLSSNFLHPSGSYGRALARFPESETKVKSCAEGFATLRLPAPNTFYVSPSSNELEVSDLLGKL